MQKECKIYAVIPARSGSKSIIDKNIQDLGGMPLIAHSILVARQVYEISKIIVTTDSKKYANIARSYGAKVVMRPEKISGDDSSDLDWAKHLLSSIKFIPDYLVHLRPTSPLRDYKFIIKAITMMQENFEATALRSVVEMPESIYKCFEIGEKYLKQAGTGSYELDEANKARHLYPMSYNANGYVDIVKPSLILNENKFHGNKVIPFLAPKITDIDNMCDLLYARGELKDNV